MSGTPPDPSQGVFETMLVLDGVPVELDAHLARLAASLDAIHGASLPAPARQLASREASNLSLGRLRLIVAPASGRCEAAGTELDPTDSFAGPRRSVELRSQPLAGGLGAHKWVDRSALPPTETTPVPLLVDRDGEVLEAAWANVFAVLDGRLATPPLDGRILPGLTRALVIELARVDGIAVEERRLQLRELRDAEEVFLTASVKGVVPAASLDGSPLGTAKEVTGSLAVALRDRWLSFSASKAAAAMR